MTIEHHTFNLSNATKELVENLFKVLKESKFKYYLHQYRDQSRLTEEIVPWFTELVIERDGWTTVTYNNIPGRLYPDGTYILDNTIDYFPDRTSDEEKILKAIWEKEELIRWETNPVDPGKILSENSI